MFVCAGQSEQFDFAVPVGIGLEDVAINLTQICMLKKPEFLFFVGTAGSYGKKKIFEIIHSKTATQIEHGLLRGDAYSPIDNMVSAAENVSCETLVNSSNYITANTKIAAHYLAKGIDLENMEFYAILKVAKKFGIPAAGVFIVTNYCNAAAHEDFLKNHQEAMARLTHYIKA
jgi:nucleoside phosphorylase